LLLVLLVLLQIELIRDRKQQLARMGVPEGSLLGHAYHTYQLTSPDGSVSFEFQHNVQVMVNSST
jgi:4-hydroxy-tetrahydrodipicolinate reductase